MSNFRLKWKRASLVDLKTRMFIIELFQKLVLFSVLFSLIAVATKTRGQGFVLL